MDKRTNCWAHFIRLIDDQLAHIPDSVIRAAIRKDIFDIQVSDSTNIFDRAICLFLMKWKNDAAPFLAYFKKNFVECKAGLYEGYSVGEPSQTNGIESSHRWQMKSFNDIKSRTPCIIYEGQRQRYARRVV